MKDSRLIEIIDRYKNMDFTGERFIPEINGTIELEHMNRYCFVINQINLKDKIVLDIASGEGYGSNLLSRNARQVIGVDISYETIEHANNKYKQDNLQYIQGDATNIPLDDNSIDVVVSFETIEHHDKHSEMITEIKRVLKFDGILIISSPDKYYYSEVPKYTNKFHVKELYYAEFKELISTEFEKTYFFSQRVFTGSIIALDEDCNFYKKPIVSKKNNEKEFLLPTYNIAIATNNSQFCISEQVVIYSTEEQVITLSDLEHVKYLKGIEIKKTITWRVGKLVLYPVILSKKILNWIFLITNGLIRKK